MSRLEQRIRELEKRTPWPGWRGGGGASAGRLLSRMLTFPYSTHLTNTDDIVSRDEELDASSAPEQAAIYTRNREVRTYCAFGTHGQPAEPFVWDHDYIILQSYIRMYYSLEYRVMGNYLGFWAMQVFAPFWIIAFPIILPWTLPNSSGVRLIGDPSEPVTPYHQNLAGGALTGIVNPVTRRTDNHLGYACMHDLLERKMITGHSQDPPGTLLTMDFVDYNDTQNGPSGAHAFWTQTGDLFASDPDGNNKAGYLAKTAELAAWQGSPWRGQTIYGFALYPLTLADMHMYQRMNAPSWLHNSSVFFRNYATPVIWRQPHWWGTHNMTGMRAVPMTADPATGRPAKFKEASMVEMTDADIASNPMGSREFIQILKPCGQRVFILE